MSNSSEFEPLWISQQDRMPDCCCVCGSFGDRKKTLNGVDYVTYDPFGKVGWDRVLHVLLSYLAPLFSLVLNRGANVGEPLTRRKKIKLPISQCELCWQATPDVIDVKSAVPPSLFVRVHPEFQRQFEAENPAASDL